MSALRATDLDPVDVRYLPHFAAPAETTPLAAIEDALTGEVDLGPSSRKVLVEATHLVRAVLVEEVLDEEERSQMGRAARRAILFDCPYAVGSHLADAEVTFAVPETSFRDDRIRAVPETLRELARAVIDEWTELSGHPIRVQTSSFCARIARVTVPASDADLIVDVDRRKLLHMGEHRTSVPREQLPPPSFFYPFDEWIAAWRKRKKARRLAVSKP